jgi:hypothetical protein
MPSSSQIIKTCRIFLDNYCSIYFFAVAIKTHYKSDNYLCKVACTLISLMNERAEPLENGELIEALIESQNIEGSTGKVFTDILHHATVPPRIL